MAMILTILASQGIVGAARGRGVFFGGEIFCCSSKVAWVDLYSLKLTAISPLKIGRLGPKRKGESIPTIHFQNAKMLVSRRVSQIKVISIYGVVWICVKWDAWHLPIQSDIKSSLVTSLGSVPPGITRKAPKGRGHSTASKHPKVLWFLTCEAWFLAQHVFFGWR